MQMREKACVGGLGGCGRRKMQEGGWYSVDGGWWVLTDKLDLGS